MGPSPGGDVEMKFQCGLVHPGEPDIANRLTVLLDGKRDQRLGGVVYAVGLEKVYKLLEVVLVDNPQ